MTSDANTRHDYNKTLSKRIEEGNTVKVFDRAHRIKLGKDDNKDR